MFPTVIVINNILETLYQIITAGVAITAVALLMYSTNFNFRDRVVLTFALILICVTLIYSGETLASVANDPGTIEFFLRVKWTGLLLLPAAYLHFSGELLTLTGRPSRGRRTRAEIFIYLVSVVGLILVWAGVIVGRLAANRLPMAYLSRNDVTFGFGLFYLLVMAMASYNLVRAFARARTTTTRRRLLYLLAGAAAPALSSIIFMFHGNRFFAENNEVFWLLSILGASLTGAFIVLMAYVVSFFGVTWTDRTIRNRLFRWLLRGPFVAAITLALTTLVRRLGLMAANPYIAYVPMVMVGTIIILEFLITVFSRRLGRLLFRDREQEDLDLIEALDQRMLTRADLDQFLEVVAASVCDRLQLPHAAIGVIDNGGLQKIIQTGDRRGKKFLAIGPEVIEEVRASLTSSEGFIEIDGNGYLPLAVLDPQGKDQLEGILAIPNGRADEFDEDQLEAVSLLAERAALAIRDRRLQTQILKTITSLQDEVDFIQEMRAAASFKANALSPADPASLDPEFTAWVRDGLTHYWGGPKLTASPLLELGLVQKVAEGLDGNRTNALREVLKDAIERTKPQGERKYTGDWLLYNLLDLKYIQGKKVREVAHKLAISEADLYRKQRVAIEALAAILVELENSLSQAPSSNSDDTEASTRN